MNFKAVILACALALVGCGDDEVGTPTVDAGSDSGSSNLDGGGSADGGNGDGGSTPDMNIPRTGIPLADLPREVAQLFCAQRSCLIDGESLLLREIFLPEGETCVERATPLVATDFLAEQVAAINAGTATYSEEAALACVESLAASTSCAIVSDGCLNDFAVGALELGDECSQGYDFCASGTTCVSEFASWRCPGTCVTAAAKGESCESMPCADPTEPDAYANCEDRGGDSGRRCYHYVYEETLGVGAACVDMFPEPVDYVVVNAGCMPGLSCEGEPGARTCVDSSEGRIAVGAACDDDDGDRCVDGAICAGTCREITLTSAVGAACGTSGTSTLVLCDPNDGVICRLTNSEALTGTCEAFGDGTEGATCTNGLDVIVGDGGCNEGFYCPEVFDGAPLAASCTAVLEDGTACSRDFECESGVCEWDGEGSVCGVPACSPPS
jgi:hypothetical protein